MSEMQKRLSLHQLQIIVYYESSAESFDPIAITHPYTIDRFKYFQNHCCLLLLHLIKSLLIINWVFHRSCKV